MHKLAKSTARKSVSGEVVIPDKLYFRIGEVSRLCGTVDQYGRTVALVFIDGTNLNEQIVAHGHGWVYRKYCKANYCNDWLKLEATARDAQVGLWENASPMPPWDWRAEQRGKDNVVSGSGNTVTTAVPPLLPVQMCHLLYITAIPEVMFFMVQAARITTAKIVL